jgi:CheY-like chemotaxis protein
MLACLGFTPHRCLMCRARFFRLSISAALPNPEARPEPRRLELTPREFAPPELTGQELARPELALIQIAGDETVLAYDVPPDPAREEILPPLVILPEAAVEEPAWFATAPQASTPSDPSDCFALPEPAPPALVPSPEPEIPTLSVLILADELPIRKLLRRILERGGYQTRELGELAGLAAELDARPADLLIADLDLAPDETVLALRPLLANPDPRVIVLSSGVHRANGCSSSCIVLEKPFNRETLLANVRTALRSLPLRARMDRTHLLS